MEMILVNEATFITILYRRSIYFLKMCIPLLLNTIRKSAIYEVYGLASENWLNQH